MLYVWAPGTGSQETVTLLVPQMGETPTGGVPMVTSLVVLRPPALAIVTWKL